MYNADMVQNCPLSPAIYLAIFKYNSVHYTEFSMS